MEKLILLDAYALIYRSYYALIKSPRINSKGLNTSAVMGFCNTLHEVLSKEQPTYLGVAFDPSGPTFRHEAYPDYKAQREQTPEDIKRSVPIIKQLLEAWRIPILEVPGYEADDVIGTLARQAGDKGIETLMLTPDKDYGQLVGGSVWQFKPRFMGGGYDRIGAREVCQKYGIATPLQVIDLLGLMGDSSDNIPGCPGVGEKTAVKLITEFGSIEGLLASTDQLKGALKKKVEENTEKIRFSKFLATIKTDVPIALDLENLSVKSPNEDELAKIFAELEFKSFAERILNKSENKQKKDNLQLSLFEKNPTEEAGEPKFSNLRALKTTPHEYYLLENEADMLEKVQKFSSEKNLVLDTETTSTSAIDAELVGMSFAVREHEAFYVPVPANRAEAEKIVAIFNPLFANEAIMKTGQNLKYDIEVLTRYGATFRGEMFDTMIAHYLIQPELHHNMDYMAETLLGYQTIRIDELIGERGLFQRTMRDLTPAEICDYACEDADITLQLKNVLEPRLREMGVDMLFREIEMPLVPVLADMELQGIRIDTQSLAETSKILTARLLEIEEEIFTLAGMHFNIASPKQVGEVLFDRMKIVEKTKKTKTGQYVTSEEVLQQLRSKHPVVGKILEHRGLKKLLGTYVDALPRLINPRTGHIHTSFNQTVTATGRLSSSDPNLQNIPVRGEDGKEIRKAFIPEPGCLFFSADYSQIELRVMAHLSGDEAMISAFREGHDIHAATAANIYKVAIDEVSRDQRTKAKRANFGIIYGITVFGLAERLDISRAEAKQLIDGYFETFPKVKAYMEQAKETARQKGYVETLFRRRRYLPDINSGNATVRGFAERNAINAPIQGTAADIIKIAMIRIHRRFREEGIRSKMILQVHDELNFSVVPEEQERVGQIVIHEMENAITLGVLGDNPNSSDNTPNSSSNTPNGSGDNPSTTAFSVALTADCGWGNNWLEAH